MTFTASNARGRVHASGRSMGNACIRSSLLGPNGNAGVRVYIVTNESRVRGTFVIVHFRYVIRFAFPFSNFLA